MNVKNRSFLGPALAMVFLYGALRFLTLWTGLESTEWTEELGVGTIAWEIFHGLHQPLWHYQLSPYAGESIALALAAQPFFRMLGPNLLALKMVPLFFSIATLLISILFLKRYFNTRAAFWVTALWVLAPPVFAAESLFVLVGHSEALVFGISALFMFYEYWFGDSKKNYCLYAAAFIGGLGFWFYNGSILIFLTCCILWPFLSPGTFFSRRLFYFILFFSAGLAPWFLSNQLFSFDSFRFLKGMFGNLSLNPLTALKNAACQLFFSIPASFTFLPHLSPWRQPAAYLFLFLFIGLLPSKPAGRKEFFFFAFPAVFIFILSFSAVPIPTDYNEGISFRYFMPLYFCGVLAASVSLSSGRVKKWILIPFLLISVAAQHPLYFQGIPGQALRYIPYSFYEAGANDFNFLRESRDYEQLLKRASIYPVPQRESFLWGSLSVYGPLWDKQSIAEAYRKMPAPRIAWLMESFGFYFRSSWKEADIAAEDLPAFLKGVFREGSPDPAKLPAEARRWAYFGAAGSGTAPADPEDRKWFYRGYGDAVPALRLVTQVYDFREAVRSAAKMVPPENLADFYWGIGWQARQFFLEDRKRSEDWLLSHIPGNFQAGAMEGFNAAEKFYFRMK